MLFLIFIYLLSLSTFHVESEFYMDLMLKFKGMKGNKRGNLCLLLGSPA